MASFHGEERQLIEDQRKSRVYTCRNPKRHIPPINLVLWRKIITIHFFVLALYLQLWSMSEMKFQILYSVTGKCFVFFLMLLYGPLLLSKGDFIAKYVSRVVFKGRKFGGARHIWGDPCSNNTKPNPTILLDKSVSNLFIQ